MSRVGFAHCQCNGEDFGSNTDPITWCATKQQDETPSFATPGCVCKNCDYILANSISTNLGLHLLGNISKCDIDVVMRFLTFGLPDTCAFVCLTLALAEWNVDRAFWTVSGGGVGQCLSSHLIANTFVSLRSFIDLHIHYTEDEFRQQRDSFMGREAPNISKGCRI